MPNTAYIALGSNIAPHANIENALELLGDTTDLQSVSDLYRTAAIGTNDQDDYLNGVARVNTPLSARALKFEILRSIEATLGRKRDTDRYAPRTIDLDILLFNDHEIDEPGLRVPDPDLRTRAFLAAGVLDIAKDAKLPDGTRIDALFSDEAVSALRCETEFSARIKKRFTK